MVEINRSLKVAGAAEMELDLGKATIGGRLLGVLLGITGKLKAGLVGSAERAEKIREALKNSFSDYAPKFNESIEKVNAQLRKQGVAKEVLFIIDGLEKTFTVDQRRRLILEESNRILKIKVNTIFTLPVELVREENVIRSFAEVVIFPFVKIQERDGSPVPAAVQRYKDFVFKRIDPLLFENESVVEAAIHYSGGSPLQLLRIIETANWSRSEGANCLNMDALKKAVARLANQMGRNLEEEEIRALHQLKRDTTDNKPIGNKSEYRPLLEKGYAFEYNDGSYKGVNPLLEASTYFQQFEA